MNKLIAILLLSVSFQCTATEIICFNDGKKIYHGYGSKIEYTSDYFMFTENKTKNVIFIFGDCLFRDTLKS